MKLERIGVLVTKRRLQQALLSLSILALVGLFVLQGPFRMIVLIFLAGLAVKSWIAYLRERQL
jgi:chromate transport protein ChrA